MISLAQELEAAGPAVVRDRSRGWKDLWWISLTDKRDAIRIYRRLGLHPIALHGIRKGRCTCGQPHDDGRSIGKHPVENGWQKTSFEFDRLDAALSDNPWLNIGLRMGKQPNGWTLVTIDVDGDRSLLAPLEAEHGALPPTLSARTGRGLHLVYRIPEGMNVPKNRVRLAPGVDVRSEGGQIVAAPSLHVLGHHYQWETICPPAELPR